MSKGEMTEERARLIVSEVIAARIRWGTMFSWPHNKMDVLDALVKLEGMLTQAQSGNSDELTKVKRQLTASLAREAKLKKQVRKLKGEEVESN